MNEELRRPRNGVRLTRLQAALLTGAMVGSLVWTGTSFVASAGAKGSVISACYKNRAPHWLSTTTTGTCPKSSTPITWSPGGVDGPVGPTGSAGSTGPTGPTGPQGPPAVSNHTVTTNSYVIQPGHLLQVSAACPVGDTIIANGESNTSGGDVRIVEDVVTGTSSPSYMELDDTGTSSNGVVAYSVCAG